MCCLLTDGAVLILVFLSKSKSNLRLIHQAYVTWKVYYMYKQSLRSAVLYLLSNALWYLIPVPLAKNWPALFILLVSPFKLIKLDITMQHKKPLWYATIYSQVLKNYLATFRVYCCADHLSSDAKKLSKRNGLCVLHIVNLFHRNMI